VQLGGNAMSKRVGGSRTVVLAVICLLFFLAGASVDAAGVGSMYYSGRPYGPVDPGSSGVVWLELQNCEGSEGTDLVSVGSLVEGKEIAKFGRDVSPPGRLLSYEPYQLSVYVPWPTYDTHVPLQIDIPAVDPQPSYDVTARFVFTDPNQYTGGGISFGIGVGASFKVLVNAPEEPAVLAPEPPSSWLALVSAACIGTYALRRRGWLRARRDPAPGRAGAS